MKTLLDYFVMSTYCMFIVIFIVKGTIITIIISFFDQGVLADKVILGHLGPGLITQDLVVFQVRTMMMMV